jgi:hypothetical protein
VARDRKGISAFYLSCIKLERLTCEIVFVSLCKLGNTERVLVIRYRVAGSLVSRLDLVDLPLAFECGANPNSVVEEEAAEASHGLNAEPRMKSTLIAVVHEFEGRWIVFDIRPYRYDARSLTERA